MAMKYLLDVNVLLAALWQNHPHHELVYDWLEEKKIVVCPLVELGCLRISSQPKVFNAPMAKARSLLLAFLTERNVHRIADDLPALETHPKKSDEVTDTYLAALAEKHGLKFATLDVGIKHASVVLIS